MKIDFDSISKYWDKYTYPRRPSMENLQAISRYVSNDSRVCILWSTQEYRTLCRDIWCSVTVVDTSKNMIDDLSVWNTKEHSIVKDWLETDYDSYDVILWDLVTHLLEPEQLSVLFSRFNQWQTVIIRQLEQQESCIEGFLWYIEKQQKSLDLDKYVNLLSAEYVLKNGKTWGGIYDFYRAVGQEQSALQIDQELRGIVPYGNSVIVLHDLSLHNFREVYCHLGYYFYDKIHILDNRSVC